MLQLYFIPSSSRNQHEIFALIRNLLDNMTRASIDKLRAVSAVNSIVDANLIFIAFTNVLRESVELSRINRSVFRSFASESRRVISDENREYMRMYLVNDCSAHFHFESGAIHFYIVLLGQIYNHIMVRINSLHQNDIETDDEREYSYRTTDFSLTMDKYYRELIRDLYH